LNIDLFFQPLLQRSKLLLVAHVEVLSNSAECAFESFEVPVLIDDLVDDSGLEYLARFVGEKEHEVVHFVELFLVAHVLLAPLRQNLLSDQKDEVSDVCVLSYIPILLWMLKAHLDSVENWPAH